MSTRTAPAALGTPDEQRDVTALAWDLTVHHLHQAFARRAFPILSQADEAGRADELTRVRVAAARHAVEDIRAALRRLDAGTYGMCQQCGCMIAADRLRERPTTPWCTVCQI